MNAIEFENVSFSYDGKTQILDHVNAALCYGEVNLLSGHSGEGKSTLLYIMSGIIPNITDGILSGEVLINGENIKGKRLGEICRKVAWCFRTQTNRLYRKLLRTKLRLGVRTLRFLPKR